MEVSVMKRSQLLARDGRGSQASSAAIPIILAIASLLVSGTSIAQDWGSDPNEEWSTAEASGSGSAPSHSSAPGWSARLGIGFTADPDTFLINIEAPYAFDRWVSVGPMFQLGLHHDDRIFAPTANVTVTIPDLPGQKLDRLLPYATAGMGFAVLEKDDRPNKNTSSGFLANVGFGLEYEINEHVFVGSQMMFNFLPTEVLDEKFFYSWQIAGLRIKF